MAVIDPTDLSKTSNQGTILTSLLRLVRGLYTFTSGNEYLTLGAALQITTSPAGTPAKATLYEDNMIAASLTASPTSLTATNNLDGVDRHFNISGVVDISAGVHDPYFDRDFAAATYSITLGMNLSGTTARFILYNNQVVGNTRIQVSNQADSANVDAATIAMICQGKLAA